MRAVTQIKVAIMSYYPQYFAVITHNTEQHCGFGSALPREEFRITPVIYPHFGNHCSKVSSGQIEACLRKKWYTNKGITKMFWK